MQSNTRDQEAQWIEQARDGSDRAFEMLVDAYQGPVFNLCYRILGNAQEAEDAAQEAFLRAYRNLHQYDRSRKFVNWMLTIASNYSIDQLRKRRIVLLPLESLTGARRRASRSRGPDDRVESTDAALQVQELLEGLAPLDRSAVILRYWDDLSYEEIGEVLGLSINAVRSRLHRTRKALAHQLEAERTRAHSREAVDEPSAI